MGLYTDAAVLAAFPSAKNLTGPQLAQAAADVVAVYDYANAQPGITEPSLRAWGEGQSITPDRMTVALGLLNDAGKLFSLPDPGPFIAQQPGNGNAARRQRRPRSTAKKK